MMIIAERQIAGGAGRDKLHSAKLARQMETLEPKRQDQTRRKI
jgi:hypothetical protein